MNQEVDKYQDIDDIIRKRFATVKASIEKESDRLATILANNSDPHHTEDNASRFVNCSRKIRFVDEYCALTLKSVQEFKKLIQKYTPTNTKTEEWYSTTFVKKYSSKNTLITQGGYPTEEFERKLWKEIIDLFEREMKRSNAIGEGAEAEQHLDTDSSDFVRHPELAFYKLAMTLPAATKIPSILLGIAALLALGSLIVGCIFGGGLATIIPLTLVLTSLLLIKGIVDSHTKNYETYKETVTKIPKKLHFWAESMTDSEVDRHFENKMNKSA